MQKALIGVIVAIVVLAGGYALLHKSKTTTYNTTNTTNAGSTAQTAAVNNAVLKTKNASGVGQYLTDPQGKALYTYNQDTSGASNCSGSCLANWPAYQDTGSKTGLPANVGTITRSDNNEVQYTYKGKPLYFFVSDSQGQVTGNGVGGFQVAKP